MTVVGHDGGFVGCVGDVRVVLASESNGGCGSVILRDGGLLCLGRVRRRYFRAWRERYRTHIFMVGLPLWRCGLDRR